LAKSVRVEVGGRWAGGGRYIWGVHKDCPEGVHKDCPLGRQPIRVALIGRGEGLYQYYIQKNTPILNIYRFIYIKLKSLMGSIFNNRILNFFLFSNIL